MQRTGKDASLKVNIYIYTFTHIYTQTYMLFTTKQIHMVFRLL